MQLHVSYIILAKSCKEIKQHCLADCSSGFYEVVPLAGRSVNVYCDMQTDGGNIT